MDDCMVKSSETKCITSGLIIYYMWGNVFFDFAPIMVIIYFHHRSFRFDN